ncbi:MAG: helix-turn-helix transcriptional regulator [Erysipelotrichaceae bacterium]|nr:helix-turn-helix transcriptional regulator [Erysipelotrichaceae bacterium]
MDFSNRLRYIRELRGLTQKQLGLAIGLSEKAAESTISQYERGEKRPRKNAIEKLALVLNVPDSALDLVPKAFPQGLLQRILFAEDEHGLQPYKIHNRCFIGPIEYEDGEFANFYKDLECWYEAYQKVTNSEWTEKQYLEWKLHYPYIKPSTVFDALKSDFIRDGYNIPDDETNLWKYVLLERNKPKK